MHASNQDSWRIKQRLFGVDHEAKQKQMYIAGKKVLQTNIYVNMYVSEYVYNVLVHTFIHKCIKGYN